MNYSIRNSPTFKPKWFIEDVLLRRTRAIYLDARVAIEIAPLVAQLMANELNFDRKWQEQQLASFKLAASKFLID